MSKSTISTFELFAMFDRTNTRFHARYHREVVGWPRIVPQPMRTNGVPVFAKVMGLEI